MNDEAKWLSTRAKNALNNAGVFIMADKYGFARVPPGFSKDDLKAEVESGRLNLKKVRNLGSSTECEILEWLGIEKPEKQCGRLRRCCRKPKEFPSCWAVCNMLHAQYDNPRNVRQTPYGTFNFKAIEIQGSYDCQKNRDGWAYPERRIFTGDFYFKKGDIFPSRAKALANIKSRLTKEKKRIERLIADVDKELNS